MRIFQSLLSTNFPLFVSPQSFLAELQWRDINTKKESGITKTKTLEDNDVISLTKAVEAEY